VARVAIALGLCALASVLPPYPGERLERSSLQSTEIVDRHGRRLHETRSPDGGYGRWVALSEISPYLVTLTLSSEDANFRDHGGIDPIGVARAVWLNARAGELAYGGSTVTQQLAGVLEPRPRTLIGKLLESRDAVRLERTLGKDRILEEYLNRVEYGRLARGAEAAAQRFFDKPARSLTLDEAALLAILPRAPSAYDPARFPERAARRRAHVLQSAAERGFVDPREAALAASAPIRLAGRARAPRGRHVLDALARRPRPAGRLVTTIDLALQERLETRLETHLAALAERDVDQAGVVVLDNATGDVIAMIGSRDYEDAAQSGAVNVTLARRPAGSTFKPFVYALAIERGAHPATPLFDVPTSFADFAPRNARQDHAGLVSLRDALGSSLNVPAVRAAEDVGMEALARRLAELELVDGRAADHGLSLALGSAPVRLVDLANAYATLARGGLHRPWRLVDPGRSPPRAHRVIDARAAYLVTDVLSDSGARRREFGVETPLELPFPAAVKTGTSKSFCDNVVVGYTPDVTVAVWVGNFDGRPMRSLVAMQGAAPLWREAMLVVAEGRPQRVFERPPGIESRDLCPLSGLLRGPHCPAARRGLVSTEHAPAEACHWHGPGGAVRWPAEIAAHRANAVDVLPGQRPIAIASPKGGTRFRIDAHLPRSRQALRLSALVAEPSVARVRWELDGRPIAEVRAPFGAFWTLEPGSHRMAAVALDETGRAIAREETRIEVDGGTR
jgi:penicillin-binding protein 1C